MARTSVNGHKCTPFNSNRFVYHRLVSLVVRNSKFVLHSHSCCHLRFCLDLSFHRRFPFRFCLRPFYGSKNHFQVLSMWQLLIFRLMRTYFFVAFISAFLLEYRLAHVYPLCVIYLSFICIYFREVLHRLLNRFHFRKLHLFFLLHG